MRNLCLLACWVFAGAVFAEEPPVVDVPLKPMVLTEGDVVLRADRPAVLPINVPLVSHVALEPGDVRSLELTLKCRRTKARIDTLFRLDADRAEFDLQQHESLQAIRLNAGQTLALVGWKSSWHYDGSVKIEHLALTRQDASGKVVTIPLPETFKDGVAETEHGRFELAGLSNRDKFPLIDGQAKVETKGDAYTVAGALRVTMKVVNGTLYIHTNGRASWDKGFNWAPALLFTPKTDGVYACRGQATLRSVQDKQNMSLLIGVLRSTGPPLTGQKLSIHRVTGGKSADVDSEPLYTHTFKGTGDGRAEQVTFDITGPMHQSLTTTAADIASLVAVIEGDDQADGAVTIQKDAEGLLKVVSRPKHVLFDTAIKPEPGVYAQMRDGKLYYGDRRLRLWSTVMDGSGQRFRALGFNCLRMWGQSDFYSADSAKRGESMRYEKGDGSSLDRYDRQFADMKSNGMFIMVATTVGRGMPLKWIRGDDSWIAGGDDWEQWKNAIAKKADPTFAYLDERLWKVRLKHLENYLNHVNPYTGKRYAEDEAIALIELENERAVVKRWCERGFDQWPDYFRNKLQRHWNNWLRDVYRTNDGLRQAWGRLDDGETLDGDKVKLAPVLSEHKKYPAQRGRDFVRFAMERVANRNQECVTLARSLAPQGVGSNVVPFSFDSQYEPSLPWQYSNSLGDTSTVSMYFWNLDSSLTRPPSLYVLDSHRTDDKLAVVYETGRSRPSRYRSEYPYMLAVMTAWQDFDIVSWHGHWMKGSPEELMAGVNLPPMSHFWTGVHLEHDPTMTSSMALAGLIYRHAAVETAPDPVIIDVGRDAAMGYERWHGIGGSEMSTATFTRGTRVRFHPDRDGAILNEGGNPLDQFTPGDEAMRTGRHVLWDWPRGRLIIDSPTAKVFIGPTPSSHHFAGGITLSGINTPWIAFAMVSADGRPLVGDNATDRLFISAVYDSQNTGFDFDWSVDNNPKNQAKAVRDLGHAPILVDPVHYTLSFPTALRGRLNGYDFAMRQVDSQQVNDANTIRRHGETWWMGELHIEQRGKARAVEVDSSPGADHAKPDSDAPAVESTDLALAKVDHPMPGLSWGDNFARAHRLLREATFTRGTLLPTTTTDAEQRRIVLSDTRGVFEKPADVELQFDEAGRMKRLSVTFTENPAFVDVIDRLQRRYGEPVAKHLVDTAERESRVKWTAHADPADLAVTATEVQGVIRIRYDLDRK
ncbi:hypothetical protein HED60_15445 [Planctomycetales bacterium ZRK34]|nr:hypothetical protein HED60_15445 [Planctomycetales bacterium ZRK34]